MGNFLSFFLLCRKPIFRIFLKLQIGCDNIPLLDLILGRKEILQIFDSFSSSWIVLFYGKQIHKLYFSMSRSTRNHTHPQRKKTNEPQHQNLYVCVLCLPRQIIAFICCFMISIKSKYLRIFKQWSLNHKNVALFAIQMLHVCSLCMCVNSVHCAHNPKQRVSKKKRFSFLYTSSVLVYIS